MALSIALTPGYTFTAGELLTNTKLNSLGNPAVQLLGTIGSATIGVGAVTTAAIATGALANPSGRDIVQNGFVTGQMLDPSAQLTQLSGTKGLTIAMGATPLHQVAISTAEVMLKMPAGTADLAGAGYWASGVGPITVDITTSGANGLDAGLVSTPGAASWYNIWLIYNPTINTVAGLFSLSASAPALPAGYTYQVWVGAVYNNSATVANLAPFYQRDNNVTVAQTLVASGTASAGLAAPAIGYPGNTTATLPAALPPTAQRVKLVSQLSNNGQFLLSPVATAGIGTVTFYSTPYAAFGAGGQNFGMFTLDLPLIAAQSFYWEGAGYTYVLGWSY